MPPGSFPRARGEARDAQIPVYLGDAMQLAVSQHFADKTLSIRVPQTNGEPPASLDFPEVLCRDPDLFDGAVDLMRRASETGLARGQFEARIEAGIKERYADLARRFPNPVIRHYGEEEARAVTDIGATYLVYDRLRRDGRDTIWPYVARNLSRPLSLSSGGGWANVVIGNPPWVAFRNMSDDLQKRFKELAQGLGVYVGRVPSHNDLSALFTARSAALYLRGSGRLAFVLPLAALTRNQFDRLRSGSFHDAAVQWEEAWTMDETAQPLFPSPHAPCLAADAQRRSRCRSAFAPILACCRCATHRKPWSIGLLQRASLKSRTIRRSQRRPVPPVAQRIASYSDREQLWSPACFAWSNEGNSGESVLIGRPHSC